MDHTSDNNQTCAICLESLLLPSPGSSSSQAKIGAVTPCGHVFHRSCWGRWYTAQRRRHAGLNINHQNKCKCPMCNASCEKFVKLFLGEASRSSRSTPPAAAAGALTASCDTDSESIVLLAKTCHDSAKRLDRVKDKLNRYKKENRTLETKLTEERRVMEATMERTVERHSKERRSWKRQQVRLQDELKTEKDAKAGLQRDLEHQKEEQDKERRKWKRSHKKLEQKLVEELEASVTQQAERVREWREEKAALQTEMETTQQENEVLRQEIDRTIELQVEERRAREGQLKRLQEELDRAQEDRLKAEAKVQKAVQGIAQMRVYHEIRKDQMGQLERENAKLAEEVRKLKEAAERHEEVLFE